MFKLLTGVSHFCLSPEDGAGTGADVAKDVTPPLVDAPKEPAKTGTILDDDKGDLPGASDWPADWREKMAGEDEKFLNKLKRYGSPLDYSKAYREMEKLVSANTKRPLPENATPEELEVYRKENNIPLKPEEYDLTLPDGLVIGEEDKPMVMEVIKELHGQNADPKMVKTMLTAYYKLQDQQSLEFHKQEEAHKNETVEALRAELGPEYSAVKEGLKGFLASQGDIGDMLANARGADNRALLNTPTFVKWLNGIRMAVDPQATVAHITGGTGLSADDRIAEIQKIIRDTPEEYYRNPKLQQEMEKLSAFKDKNKKAA